MVNSEGLQTSSPKHYNGWKLPSLLYGDKPENRQMKDVGSCLVATLRHGGPLVHLAQNGLLATAVQQWGVLHCLSSYSLDKLNEDPLHSKHVFYQQVG